MNSLAVLAAIQHCAKRADEQQDVELAGIVDTLLSALMANNGLRHAYVTLPAAVREHHARACLISEKV